MSRNCGFCKKKSRINLLVEINKLKHGEAVFTDIVRDIFNIEIPVKFGCKKCIDLIKSQYDYKQNVLRNQSIKPPRNSKKTSNVVKQFLTKNKNEEIEVFSKNDDYLLLVRKSKENFIKIFKHFKKLDEAKVVLRRIEDESLCDQSMNDDDDDGYDLINHMLEPLIEIQCEESHIYESAIIIDDENVDSNDVLMQEIPFANNNDNNDVPMQEIPFAENNGITLELTQAEKDFIQSNIVDNRICRICKVQKNSRPSIYAHVKVVHLNNKSRSQFDQWVTRKIHEGKMGVKSFKCLLCEKIGNKSDVYKSSPELRAHIMTHKKSENFFALWRHEIVKEEENDAAYSWI